MPPWFNRLRFEFSRSEGYILLDRLAQAVAVPVVILLVVGAYTLDGNLFGGLLLLLMSTQLSWLAWFALDPVRAGQRADRADGERLSIAWTCSSTGPTSVVTRFR